MTWHNFPAQCSKTTNKPRICYNLRADWRYVTVGLSACLRVNLSKSSSLQAYFNFIWVFKIRVFKIRVLRGHVHIQVATHNVILTLWVGVWVGGLKLLCQWRFHRGRMNIQKKNTALFIKGSPSNVNIKNVNAKLHLQG